VVFFFGKKPLDYINTPYSNSENALLPDSKGNEAA
jgi:hypothetical protein